MLILRSARRAAAVVCAAGVAIPLVAAPNGWASPPPALSSAASTTTTTVASTTTTTKPPTTTSTSTTSTTSTTVAPKPKGVPNVPVGGPPTTKPAPGKPKPPPAPPPDPGPILTAVQSDLDQLTAIAQYPPALTAVADRQQAVTLAASDVQQAMAGVAQAQAGEQLAQNRLGTARQRVKGLAIAAYIGLGYATPTGSANANGTVNTAGGLSGTEAADANEMLRLVAQHDRADLAATRKELRRAQAGVKAAAKLVAQARAVVAQAQTALQAAQQVVAQLSRAATTPAGTAPATAAAAGQGGSGGGGSGGASGGLTALGAPPTTAIVAAAATSPSAKSPDILGPPVLTAQEMAAWFASTSRKANITVPMAQLATDYAKAGQATGVRDDIAFAQSVVETGFFSFPSYGQLTPKDNNFAGIGACDSCAHGWSFKNAATGVAAQLELLEAYASSKPVPTPLVGNVGVGGCCPTWMALAGRWASNLEYGIEIMTVYHQMLSWVIPQRLIAAGLLAPPPVAAKGPTLAQLPGSKVTAKPAKAPPHH